MAQVKTINGKELKEPIEVIEFDVDGHYYASNSEYKIYADASSKMEAIASFLGQLEDMYHRFKKLHDLIK